LISENPYRLARDIRGIGFRTADAIAMKLGIEKTAMIRARAEISFALTEALDGGHCGLPRDDLLPQAAKLLEILPAIVLEALRLELEAGEVIADQVERRDCIFLAGLYYAERAIADRLRILLRGPMPWKAIDAEKAIPWVEARTGLPLAESQKTAIRVALRSKVMVVTGGPGVGKTTLVNSILRILAAKNANLLLCAPTGRAAKRMSETTGHEAKTIHRLLEIDPKTGSFRRNEMNPLDCDLLVIDETSMVDVMLMNSLLKAVADQTAVLFVGDVDQLPPVGPGQALADIIASGLVPVVRLTEVFRQAAQSAIVQSAHKINAGQIPDLSAPRDKADFYFVSASEQRLFTGMEAFGSEATIPAIKQSDMEGQPQERKEIAWQSNAAQAYAASGRISHRLGNSDAKWAAQEQGLCLAKETPWRQNGADGASIKRASLSSQSLIAQGRRV
jgi:exodeoxyribonuclease V alpha subunit